MTDRELLDKYLSEGSREAMGELMQRHVGMVNATAMREVGNASLADDVAQAVFLVLMRRAKHLSPRVRIGGWLFKVTRYAAADARKREARRAHHEREASKMANAQPQEATWQEIEPVLNNAIAALGKADRDAVIMRYLEGRSVGEIAQAEGGTENAMRQRIMRALRRLKKHLAKRGIVGSAAVVGTVLEEKAAHAAPPALVQTISATIGGSPVPPGPCDAIAKGVLHMMRKMKVAALAGATALLALVLAGGYFGLRMSFADGTVAAMPPGTTIAPTTAPAQAAVARSPKEALRAAYQVAMTGDADALIAACDGLTNREVAMLRQIAPAMKAMSELEQAIAAKFGDDVRAKLESSIVGVDPADLVNATEQINGDNATVDIGMSGPGKVGMVRVNGQWKISAATIAAMPPEMAAQAEKMIPMLHRIRDNITGGKYASLDQLQRAMAGIMRGG